MIYVDSNSTDHNKKKIFFFFQGASNLIGKGLPCRGRKCWIVAGLARKSNKYNKFYINHKKIYIYIF